MDDRPMTTEQHDLRPHTNTWEMFQKLWTWSSAFILVTLALMWIFLV